MHIYEGSWKNSWKMHIMIKLCMSFKTFKNRIDNNISKSYLIEKQRERQMHGELPLSGSLPKSWSWLGPEAAAKIRTEVCQWSQLLSGLSHDHSLPGYGLARGQSQESGLGTRSRYSSMRYKSLSQWFNQEAKHSLPNLSFHFVFPWTYWSTILYKNVNTCSQVPKTEYHFQTVSLIPK